MTERRCVSSASTRARLDAVLGFLSGVAPGHEALVIGPSRAALDELAYAHARGPRATFGIHRKTLAAFASELAAPALAARGRAIAPPLALLAIARDVVAGSLAAGTVPLLARRPPGSPRSAAESPGFASAFGRTAHDLRSARVPAARLTAMGGLTAEVGVLLEAYEAELATRALADRADVATEARSALAGSLMAGLPVVLFDVAIRSRAERELIAGIVGASPRALLVVASSDHVSLGHVAALGLPTEGVARAAPAPLDAFRDRLFAEEATPTADAGDAVSMIAAPGEGIETLEIVRSILAEARRGVPFDQMAIAIPSRETYAAHIEAALARAKVPAYFEGGSRRPHASGRALSILLGCKIERGSGRRLAEYLATAELPRVAKRDVAAPVGPTSEDLGRFGDREEPPEDEPDRVEARAIERPSLRRWERLLGEAGVTQAGHGVKLSAYLTRRLRSARAVLEDTLIAFPDEHAPARGRAERDLEALDDLAACLGPVLAALDAVPESATWREMIDSVRELALVAVKRPELVLAVLSELEPLAASTLPIDLPSVRAVLDPRLVAVERPSAKTAFGRVLVTTPVGLRGRARRVVFVPGLAERLFPERIHEDPLLVDDVRRGLDDTLETQADRAAGERDRLLTAAGAATERLRFSYPRVDVDADRARVPSLFGLEVARAERGVLPYLDAFESSARLSDGARMAWPAPRDPATAIDAVEEELAFLGELLADRDRSAGRARFLIVDHPHVRSALQMRWRRHHHPQLGSADGLFPTRPLTLQILAGHRLTARPTSASLLQAFTACPYRYYLQAIAQLTARVDVVPIERLDPATLGSLHHQCQAATLRRLADAGLSPSDPARADEARALAKAAIREVAERERARLEPLLDRVFDRDVADVERDVLGALEVDRAENDGFVPLYAELGFGAPRPGLDPHSVPDPVAIRGFLLRGAIDRVDRTAGGEVRVTDFKTGRLPDIRGTLIVGQGRLNQALLYAMALEALAGRVLEPGDRVTGARFFFSTERAGFESKPIALEPDSKERGVAILKMVDAAVERGLLLARPQKDACRSCDFRDVCGPDEERRSNAKRARTLTEKALERDLTHLRGMP